MIEIARSNDKLGANTSGPTRARRLFEGWSANLVQLALGISQQVLLVPIFLHFWTSDVLAAWFAIYAAGNLVGAADVGLQMRAINRFFAFKACADPDGRTGRFYGAMLRIYVALVATLTALLLIGTRLKAPSAVLGFSATPHFDAALVAMTVGMLLTLPSSLVSALYRARGNYGRVVWLQSGAMFAAQLAQLLAMVASRGLLAVTIAYVSIQLLMAIYLVAVDAPRMFPFLGARSRARPSLRWSVGQIGQSFPFAVAGVTELTLTNAPVLLVSALVADRVAVAQWALTRVIAGLVRMLCVQATLPLAAELGHDYAVGDNERLRNLYARGSVFVTLLASLTVSGLLPFGPDFFALWTRGSVPYDSALTITILLGATAVAPSILALGFANYSNRGDLLARSKGLQLAVFLILSVVLISPMGPLGAAIAIVASDLLVQFGLLTLTVIVETLQHPFRHIVWLAAVVAAVVLSGWAAGTAIGWLVPWTGAVHFVVECTLWLVALGLAASPLAIKRFRESLVSAIPR